MDVNYVDQKLISDLRQASKDCLDRGLLTASKWSSELLLSISPRMRNAQPPPTGASSSQSQNTPTQAFPQSHEHAPLLQPISEEYQKVQQGLEEQEYDIYVSARAAFESREFLRVMRKLAPCQSAKSIFLRTYAEFIASEKMADREWHKLDCNRNQPPTPINAQLPDLLNRVTNATDPWLLFLKALFLSRVSRREEAIECALLSIAGCPWNWSTWLLLGTCIGDGDELSSLLPLFPLPQTHPLIQMFQIKTLNELHHPSDNELKLCDRLLSEEFFPNSSWVMSLRACVLYHLHDFPEAEKQFEKILSEDPYRIDDIDIYSNILYVTESRLKLSRLAHDFLALDKDRPEICCLVGNHYSLRAEHEKAIKYFQRATQLDRTYLAAWTLMGHEYVEIKNSHAAIDSYRRAVDVNRKDYRAWYGLGQAYELLNMHQYALYYYQHATALRPYDVRLWQAHASCYQELGRPKEAIECLKRALLAAEPSEITINLKLAYLFSSLNEHAEAATYHRRVVDVVLSNGGPVQDFAKSALNVAAWNMTINDDLILARDLLERVANSNSEEVARATILLKDCRTRIEEQQRLTAKQSDMRSQEGPAGMR